MTHSLSEPRSTGRARYLALSVLAVLAIGAPLLGALVTTDRYIVAADAVISEDQYVTAMSAIVEGRIEGDLTIFTGDLTISGEVTGSVTVFSVGSVTVASGGSIGGSLNGTALSLTVSGHVGSDVFVASGSAVIEESGTVGRDAISFGGTSRFEGVVGRDVRGRSLRVTVDGHIDGDVDVATQSLGVGPTAVIGGDILYRSAADADISADATVVGTVTKLPAQGNFLYGIILTVANVVGFMGFVLAGLVVFWLLRGTSARATGAILTRPLASLGAGVVAVIVLPALIVLMAITLVGLPFAVVLLALAVVLFVVGPVPAVTALGNRVLVRRGGLFGALIVGSVLWRLGIWLIPYVGAVLYVVGMVWGVGGWLMGAMATRRSDPIPIMLLPASVVAREDDSPWEPPLAPGMQRSQEPDSGLDGSDDFVGTVPDTVDESSGPDVVVPPVIRTDTLANDEAVRFDVADRDEHQSDTEGDDTGGDDTGGDGAGGDGAEGDGARPGASASERFAALREELASTGTVEPPSTGDDEPDGEGPPTSRPPDDDDGWGLPTR